MSDDLLFYVQPPTSQLELNAVPEPCDQPANPEPSLEPVPRQRRVTPVLPDPLVGTFEEFWRVYPRKVSKAHARTRYAKQISDGADPAAILAAAEEFRDFCKDTGREQKFIRHPGRWLIEASWEKGLPFADAPPRPACECPHTYQPDDKLVRDGVLTVGCPVHDPDADPS